MSDAFHADCPARAVLDHVTSRWAVLILTAMADGPLRFYELRDKVEKVSEKMLSQTLRTLMQDGFVAREVAPTTPPAVSYSLTPLGRGITEPLRTLTDWIRDHADAILDAQATTTAG